MELSVNVFVSLDGVVQGPGAPEEDRSGGFTRGGWLVPYADADFGEVVDGWFARTGAVLLGRSTYVMMRDYWPQVQEQSPVTAALNDGPKYLVSTTLGPEDCWGDTTIISDDVLSRVAELKRASGEQELQVHGSWQLARALHAAGLVDRFRLLQFPVVVGQGKRLFDGAAPSGFRLVATRTTAAGATHLELEPTPFHVGGFEVVDGRESVVEPS